MQAEGQLGCFSLTEKLAGVLSGFIVGTTATYDSKRGGFVINSPTVGSRKNWISQGFTADKTVVLADLILESGESKGPHAFVMELRAPPVEADDESSSGVEGLGKLVPNVACSDMGVKTVGNDLDNAEIRFEGAFVPRGALLGRYCEVDASGEYRVRAPGGVGVSPFEMIGQRLFTGRVCVAQAALEYRRTLFARTRRYCESKRMAPSPGESSSSGSEEEESGRVLGDLPQLKKLFADDAARLQELDAFCAACERELCQVLKEGGLPSASLVDAIATAKVLFVSVLLPLLLLLLLLLLSPSFCCLLVRRLSQLVARSLAHLHCELPRCFAGDGCGGFDRKRASLEARRRQLRADGRFVFPAHRLSAVLQGGSRFHLRNNALFLINPSIVRSFIHSFTHSIIRSFLLFFKVRGGRQPDSHAETRARPLPPLRRRRDLRKLRDLR